MVTSTLDWTVTGNNQLLRCSVHLMWEWGEVRNIAVWQQVFGIKHQVSVAFCIMLMFYFARLWDPETDWGCAERRDSAKRDPGIRFQIRVSGWKSSAVSPGFSHYNTLSGIPAWFISPTLCWGWTIMVMMMNRAIWMLLSARVICELCAARGSQNELAASQLRPPSSSGTPAASHKSFHIRGMFNIFSDLVFSCENINETNPCSYGHSPYLLCSYFRVFIA